ncbi:hypothetical protein A3C87_02625 [Candidatus Kaiserbacteria bacterium RIFCSPHIGHO2_02_FULL_49_34]|uniref:UDP-N-acetylmuramoyl-tripeptide--D-alanyl-D-alanine ligase n=1 Tax=Candidatus Kaiserbacteria bacterium RIFCSPHIGHO2_02_FULL_49_34 TaxID=1798491 RepID=A0A1F6DJD9_9BACT|nr:MAG: hypothetical protein A3C87_02625 [Candidatus Kaiserbacteria bacterium RIFCSPHIGHO2_02_FULL_49_34]
MKSVIKNVLVAMLTAEARGLLRRTKPAIIAITGSVGKTGTKDAIYTALKDKIHVRKSAKSFNSDVGVPLSVLGIENPGTNIFLWIRALIEGFVIMLVHRDYPDVLVLEVGVDRPGDMAKLTSWVRPDIVVLTRFPDVPVHVENFPTAEAVAEEKKQLLYALKDDGVIVYNNDDERIVRAVSEMRQVSVGFSRYSRSSFVGASETNVYEHGVPVGFEFVLNTQDTSHVVRVRDVLGVGYVYVHTAAIAVATLFEIPVNEAIASLEKHVAAPGRMRLLPGVKGTHIIDDTYNASPVAALEALRTLRSIKNATRRIAVLGDMLELGQYSIDEHHHIGEAAAESVDMLVTVGVRARGIAEGALRAGLDEANITQYDDALEAARDLEQKLVSGDYVLIKGSQGMRLERAVEEIMAEPERAEELLVRQDAFWKSR